MSVQIDEKHRHVGPGLVAIDSIGCDRNSRTFDSDKALCLVDDFSSHPVNCVRGGIIVI